MSKQALIACKISQTFEKALIERGWKLIPYTNDYDADSVKGILSSTKMKLDTETLQLFPNLQWVGRLGSGMEIIDMDYCRQNDIVCVSSPLGISNAVAEHICGMLISWHKNIQKSAFELREKLWSREPNRGQELSSKTLGIIGCGHTGSATAKLMRHLCKEVIVYDKYVHDISIKNVRQTELKELQENADIISFHLPTNEETKHYYDEEFIKHCKKHLLVNSSRGGIVSSQALLKALKNGTALGACLDVLEGEEYLHEKNHEHWKIVRELSDFGVIITPHVAGYSHEAIEKMSTELFDQLNHLF